MIERLKQRADFLQAARGKRAAMPGLVLQMRQRAQQPKESPQLTRQPPQMGAKADASPDTPSDTPSDMGEEAAKKADFRVGYTVTRKVGNAVTRNRAKRRLRAAANAILPRYGLPGRDYVVIGRAGTLTRPFTLLLSDLEKALAKVHGRAHLSPAANSIPASGLSETHPDNDRRKP